ncbi:asparaginase [Phytoactinopolyspora alkaliphila]|uniref:asparaginase n=1 Tax=Phytoactinopolyspora alkaliphila TaxID=1783498 RepID=A0A6N9YKM0_9ACTN|nr:asparaginase [Phytoactinopolyspora alkaliphila]NED95611.1 asparaginase [Phytoactinopolyspora alkaliphila]
MRRVVLLTTGGTIASRLLPQGGYGVATSSSLAAPVVDDIGHVDVRSVTHRNSFDMTHRDIRQITESAADALSSPDVAGVVVAHGTDTLAETAALQALIHADRRPVVVTGAQRPPDHAEPDGPRNLADAIRVAAHPSAQGLGPLVVFGKRVLPAWGTTKAHTASLSAFLRVLDEPAASHGGGRDLSVPGLVSLGFPIRRPDPLPAPTPVFDHMSVPVVTSHVGADGQLLDLVVAAGADAVLIVGTGLGNVTTPLARAVERAVARGLPIGVSSRTLQGPLAPIYRNGGGRDLVDAGAVLLTGVDPGQARIFLALVASLNDHDSRLSELRRYASRWCAQDPGSP